MAHKRRIVDPPVSGPRESIIQGREATEAFGKAYEHWLAELPKPDSSVSKLNTRFRDCGTLVSRWSYITQ